MQKIFFIALLAAVLIGGAAWLARPGAQGTDVPTQDAASTLTASENSFSFGTLSMADGDVVHEVQIMNTGSEPVTIGRTYTSCMCTSVAVMVDGERHGPFGMSGMGYIARVGETLMPGASAMIAITFDPAAHGPAGIGHITRQVTMEVDGQQPVNVLFSADVTP